MRHVIASALADSDIGTGDSLIVPRSRPEQRCAQLPSLAKDLGARIIEVAPLERRRELLDIIAVPTSGAEEMPHVALRDPEAVASWLRSIPGRVLVDISCLPHAVWAALVRASVLKNVEIVALYAEPERYEALETTVLSHEIDLSLSIEGVGPLPGFSSIRPRGRSRTIVFLLGFEGGRVGHAAASVGVDGANVRAIVGSPGMRPGYDEAAVEGNRSALERLGLEVPEGLVAVPADDPFAARNALLALSEESSDSTLIIIPLGPRPQALGAILFYLDAETAGTPTPQIIYDHAVRDPRGSAGLGTIHLYGMGKLQEDGA